MKNGFVVNVFCEFFVAKTLCVYNIFSSGVGCGARIKSFARRYIMADKSLVSGLNRSAFALTAAVFGLTAVSSGEASVISPTNTFPPAGGVFQTPAGTAVSYSGQNMTVTRLAFTPTDSGVTLSSTADTEETQWPLNGDLDFTSSGAKATSPITVSADIVLSNSVAGSNFKLVAVKTISWARSGDRYRNSPITPSTGEFDVVNLPDGTFQIDGSLDLYTQISRDGGATWHDASAPIHLDLTSVPEPASLACVLPLSGFILRRRRTEK